MRPALIIVACCLVLAAIAVPVIALCNAEQTQAYIAQDTSYVFTKRNVDYVIVIDKSGSMQGAKIDKVKEAVKALIAKLPDDDRAAIISFNYDTTLNHALSTNRDELAASLDDITAQFGTQYVPALRLALKQFTDPTRQRALIFLSDGKDDFTGSSNDVTSLTEAIARENVCVFTISYAVEGEEGSELSTMARVGKQEAGCGEHYSATEKGTELDNVFNRIKEVISSTDLIRVEPKIVGDTYSVNFFSKLNNKTIPGSSGNTCVDDPAFTLEIFRNDRLLKTLTDEQGVITLPAGQYSYKASAFVHCGGECSYSGEAEGSFSTGQGCSPSYAQLVSYATGDTQYIKITPSGFDPRTTSGRQGTPIIWNNTDVVPHRITSPFFNVTVQPGGSYDYVIGNVGTLLFRDPDKNFSASIETIKGSGTDFIVIMDQSGSMRGDGITESQAAARQFFSVLAPSDRAAIITFSAGAMLLEDFTSDKQTLTADVDKFRAEGATSYLSALHLAATLHPLQHTVVVFMSDGVPTDPEGENAILDAANDLRKRGWCMMTVGFGDSGATAKATLSKMAGTDACAAFLYASKGDLQQVFGTVYQLSSESEGLTFTNLDVPSITFSDAITITTKITTKTGNPVPGGTSVCAPEAVVQARSGDAMRVFDYANGTYSGVMHLQSGKQQIALTASISSLENLERPISGSTTRTVIYLPLSIFVAVCTTALLISAIVIYRFTHRPLDDAGSLK